MIKEVSIGNEGVRVWVRRIGLAFMGAAYFTILMTFIVGSYSNWTVTIYMNDYNEGMIEFILNLLALPAVIYTIWRGIQ